MKRPKLKKGSKRMSCSKRYKIQRRVKEHNRKVKKESKKKGVSRKPKRDISIPNNAPFKEDILREAELRKQRREELKAQQKLERQKEVAKKRKLEVEKKKKMEDKKEKPTKKKEKKEKKVATKKPAVKNPTRSLCREVNKVIEAADIILEVLDARDPLGSRCVQAEQAVLQSPNKKLLLVLNKIDLVPKDSVEKWLRFLSNELPTILFRCSARVEEKCPQSARKKADPKCLDTSKGTVCNGEVSLLRVLRSMCPSQGKAIKVGLIGFSNAGKSSLINTLKKYRVCNVGTLKGTTRIMQEVNIDERIKILDSPSLVVSPDNPPETVVMRSTSLKDDDDHVDSVNKILNHCDKQEVILRYKIPDYRNPMEFLDLLANRRGILKTKGVADLEGTAKVFLNDWMGAKLSYYTQPPASFTSHINGKKISAMKKAVNTKMINEENIKNMKSMRNPTPSSSIAFHYAQITNGIIDENEIKEQEQEPTDMENEEEIEEREDEDISEDEENETPEVEGDQSASMEKPVKSVIFDKPAESANDDYDFNADFN